MSEAVPVYTDRASALASVAGVGLGQVVPISAATDATVSTDDDAVDGVDENIA